MKRFSIDAETRQEILNNVFEAGKKAIDRVSRWRSIEPTTHTTGHGSVNMSLSNSIVQRFEAADFEETSSGNYDRQYQPNDRVPKLSCNGSNAVDVLIMTVEKAAHQLGWLVVSCSPRLGRGEHIKFFEKLGGKYSNNANVSVSTTLKNESTEGSFCRLAELIQHSIHPPL